MNKIGLTIFIVLLLFLFSNFNLRFYNNHNDNNQGSLSITESLKWTKIDNGLFFIQIKKTNKLGINKNLTIVKIDPLKFKFEIQQDINNPRDVVSWGNSDDHYIVVINGSFFDKGNQSTGYLLINGQEFGPKIYNGKFGYTGMVLIGDSVELRYLPEKPLSRNLILSKYKYSLQSYPTIILPGGRKGIIKKLDKQARRSIIAKDRAGNILFIVTPNSEFSLSEIMEYLLNLPLNIDIAINLDGGSSTGLYVKLNNFSYNIASAPVPNVIMVKKK